MRNLTKTIAAVSMLAPVSAYPLGIGEIKLHSALNQNLDAEIALMLAEDESISDVMVRLAPPEKFDEAGVPWSYFLSKIKFEAVVQADGSAIVKISSKEAYREPFLDFLLEVSWTNGNLYREFTVLIDPPVAYTQPVVPVIQKTKQEENLEVEEIVEETIVVEEATEGSSDVITEVTFNQAPVMDGPTKNGDTLWEIAEDTNSYEDVSIEQMMMAIYEANPKAFYKDNVNALMVGRVLDIPEKELILKMSRKQALIAFTKHDKEWKGRVAVKPKEQEPDSDSDTKLILEAPVESEIPETAIVESEKAASTDNVVEAETETETETEAAIELTTSEETLALIARMEQLEQKLASMQKVLIFKDKEIAALQVLRQEKPATVPEKAPKPEESISEIKVDSKTEQPSGKEVKQVIKTDPKVIKKPEVKPAKKPKVKPAPKPVIQPEPESDFMPDFMTMLIGGFGTVILALLGLMWWRKKNSVDEIDTESMFAAASEISFPDSAASDLSLSAIDDDASSYDVGTVGESSFLSEFTPSDFDAFDSDQNEVDPISEADVYLAYGRYQQAEDLMRQAIEDQPERDECKLKLLEIFYANEDKTAYEEYATKLVSEGKNSEQEFWGKVAEMGLELEPDSSLYTEQAVDKATFETKGAEEVTEDSIENSVDESMAANNQSEGESLGPLESDNEAEFDLSVFDEDKEEPEDEATATDNQSELESVETAEPDNEAEFDLSVFDEDKEEPEDEATATDNQSELESVETTEPDNDAEIDLSVIDEDNVESESQAEEKTEDANLDFDLSVFDIDESKQTDDSETKPNTEEIESVDFGLDSSVDDAPVEIEKKAEAGEIESLDFGLDTTPEAELDSDVGKDESPENYDFLEEESVPTSIATESTSPSEEPEAEEAESFDTFDLDTTKPNDDTGDVIELNSEVDEDESLENFDFSADESVPASVDTESTGTSDEPDAETAESFETFEFDFDLETDTPESEPEPTSAASAIDALHDFDEGVSDLTDMDELETKIDLAKAYVDMGDSDAAKSIAEEVLIKGNDEQKKIAQEIIDQL